MTYRQLIFWGTERLLSAGVPDAALDAWYLLEHVLQSGGVSDAGRAWYFLHADEPSAAEQALRFRDLIGQRCRRIPLQQLTGEQAFMGLSFYVNGDVLIPRQDTETLAEEALAQLKSGMSVLDMCTGSGCIIVSLSRLAKERDCRIACAASDLSEAALFVARTNAKRHGADVRFFQGNLFENVEGTFDVIVSNPPYIRAEEIPGLMPEVSEYEQRMALDGGADGLIFYRRLAAEAPRYLKPGGRLLLEIGADQGEEVRDLLIGAGFCNVYIKKDLAGLDRVAAGQYPA